MYGNVASIIRTLRLDHVPTDNVPEDTTDNVERMYQPHLIGRCGSCKSDVDITIGRSDQGLITCPVCGVLYRTNRDGTFLSVLGKVFAPIISDCDGCNDCAVCTELKDRAESVDDDVCNDDTDHTTYRDLDDPTDDDDDDDDVDSKDDDDWDDYYSDDDSED